MKSTKKPLDCTFIFFFRFLVGPQFIIRTIKYFIELRNPNALSFISNKLLNFDKYAKNNLNHTFWLAAVLQASNSWFQLYFVFKTDYYKILGSLTWSPLNCTKTERSSLLFSGMVREILSSTSSSQLHMLISYFFIYLHVWLKHHGKLNHTQKWYEMVFENKHWNMFNIRKTEISKFDLDILCIKQMTSQHMILVYFKIDDYIMPYPMLYFYA